MAKKERHIEDKQNLIDELKHMKDRNIKEIKQITRKDRKRTNKGSVIREEKRQERKGIDATERLCK